MQEPTDAVAEDGYASVGVYPSDDPTPTVPSKDNANYQPAKKRNSPLAWVILVVLLALISGSVIYLIATDRHEAVLAAIGIGEKTVSTTEEQKPEQTQRESTTAVQSETTVDILALLDEITQAPIATTDVASIHMETTLAPVTLANGVHNPSGSNTSNTPGTYLIVTEGSILNLRVSPSQKVDIVVKIPDMTIVSISETTFAETLWWGYTSYAGQNGWVAMRFLEPIPAP